MKLVEINWKPADRQLRQFATLCLAALPLAGWWWGASRPVIGGLAAVGALVALLGWLRPPAVKPLFVGLSIASAPIGLVVGELAMLVVFFGVFLPIGLCFRLVKRDALQLKLDREAKSYWQPKKQPKGAASYYRQS